MSVHKKQQGSIIVSILVIMIFLTTIIFALMTLANTNISRARTRVFALQTLYAAESGADIAVAQLNNIGDTYEGSNGEKPVITGTTYKATYSTSVTGNGSQRVITSTGKVYIPANAAQATYSRTIEVLAERSSAQFASAMVSRNIIDIGSGVKNIKAKDIYVNGYIRMAKNTNSLIAENVTVAGKNTGAANCSIDGTGNLVKPTVFSTPGQTKTNLSLGYNNCISPPGNSSNADFNVLANQTTIDRVQSTLIPFSQYMDGTYLDSNNGCSDWTTGAFPRDIPSTGNAKKTHYPDNGNGVSTDCGTSGDLYLEAGQYNIKDHIHLRANLCAADACDPTFYNPDQGQAGLKFVFIEGNVNFNSLHTAAGSGPVVFVIYGPDPMSKVGACPLGGSFFLGNTSMTSAPAAYVLSQNGVCLYQTKFSTDPALGGATGKNIYISTNSGTPFDLSLDPQFPVNGIPINLSWKAIRYRRL